MFKGKVKFGTVKQPLCLLSIKIVRLVEIGQVFMVHENLDCMRGTEKVMLPSIQGSHNGEQLPIIDVVVVFSWTECLGKISAGVPVSIGIFL